MINRLTLFILYFFLQINMLNNFIKASLICLIFITDYGSWTISRVITKILIKGFFFIYSFISFYIGNIWSIISLIITLILLFLINLFIVKIFLWDKLSIMIIINFKLFPSFWLFFIDHNPLKTFTDFQINFNNKLIQ